MRKFFVVFLIFFSIINSAIANDNAFVLKILDGDSIIVKIADKEENIRLIGLDCPEKSKNNRAYKQAYANRITIEKIINMGYESLFFLESILKKNDEVIIEYGNTKRDRYDRLLAYVYLKDGTMLNEIILKNGYAMLFIYPDTKHKNKLFQAYRYAQKNKLGLFK